MRPAGFAVLAALVIVVAGTGAALTGATTQPLPASFCSPIDFSGKGSPKLLLVSDLPLLGLSRFGSVAMTRAMRFVLAQHSYRAGRYSVGYQSCDDSNPQTESGDLSKCAANAKEYADNRSVVGVIGTWSSRCSAVEIPIANTAHGGPLVMVSPSNTSIGLTRAAPGTDPGEPGRYYPTGRRSFARLIAPDDVQGAAIAMLARELRVRRMYVLDDKDPYSISVKTAFARAARSLRLRIVGTGSWNPEATGFDDIGAAVKRARADGVLLSGVQFPNCGLLFKSVRDAVGPRGVIVAPDGFTLKDLLASVASANGLYGSSPALPPSALGAMGRRIVHRFGTGRLGSGGPVYAAEAMEVMLNAIAHSSGSRASVTSHVLGGRIRNGIIGSFRFDKNGDIDPVGVAILQIAGRKLRLDRALRVPGRLFH
jgi:branched-chain amino acid transport system substrate-binding protein